MRNDEAIRIICSCAKKYHENLLNRNLLFVYGSIKNPKFLETSFLSRNFLHLTGIRFNSSNKMSSSEFLTKAYENKLPLIEYIFDSDGIVERKLMVLPTLMNIHLNAKMVGKYDD